MIKTKYIPVENANILVDVLTKIKNAKDLVFKVYDTESHVVTTKDVEKLINSIDGGDEEIGINLFENEKCIGWIGVLPYEDEDSVIFDHSDNEFLNEVMR